MKYLILFFFAVTGVACPFLSAQSLEEPKIDAELRLFTFTNPIRNWLLVNGEEGVSVILSNSKPSAPYRYSGDGSVFFYTETVSPEGEVQRAIQARTRIDGNQRKYLLIVDQSAPGAPTPFRITVFPGDLKDYPVNSYVFVNTSNRELAGKISERTFQVKPGKHEVVQVDPELSRQQVSMQFAAMEEEKGWKSAYSNLWTFRSGARYIVFITDDPVRKGSLKFRTIRELGL